MKANPNNAINSNRKSQGGIPGTDHGISQRHEKRTTAVWVANAPLNNRKRGGYWVNYGDSLLNAARVALA